MSKLAGGMGRDRLWSGLVWFGKARQGNSGLLRRISDDQMLVLISVLMALLGMSFVWISDRLEI